MRSVSAQGLESVVDYTLQLIMLGSILFKELNLDIGEQRLMEMLFMVRHLLVIYLMLMLIIKKRRLLKKMRLKNYFQH